jgi:predicted porin
LETFVKKTFVACSALCGLTANAYAQSSVTLYGVIDQGVNMITNVGGGRVYNVTSGVMMGSRWGLKGSEDLGGSLKAIFTIENGFDGSTGKFAQGGLGFGRQAFVGLSSSYGTVTIGRQYDSVVDYVGLQMAADVWGGYIAAHPGDVDNFNNSFRANNAVKFTSTNYHGLTFGGLYSFGGVAGDITRNQVWSLGAGYNRGPIQLGIGYLNARSPNVGFFGNSTSGTPSASVGNLTSAVTQGFGSARTYQVIGAAGTYTIGQAAIGVTYSNVKFENLGSTYSAPAYAGKTATFNVGEISFRYFATPTLLLGVAYDYTRGTSFSGAPTAQYHSGVLGVDYFLSKRTDVYVVGVYQHASGSTLGADGQTIIPAVANISLLGASNGQNQATIRMGIRVKF